MPVTLRWATPALLKALASPAYASTRDWPADPGSEFEIDERDHLDRLQAKAGRPGTYRSRPRKPDAEEESD